MWLMETLQSWCVSKGKLERIIPIEASIASGPVRGQDKNQAQNLFTSSVTSKFQNNREKNIANFSTNIQNYKRM